MEEDKTPFETLQDWKSKPYQKTNYENIHIFYGNQKYIRMKPKSKISLTPGLLHMIIKQPGKWLKQNFKLEQDVTLLNNTHGVLYYTLIQSLLSNDNNEFKLEVKNGVINNEERWDS